MTYLAASLWLLGAVGMWIEMHGPHYLGPGELLKLILLCACWPAVIVWAVWRWGIGK